MKRMSATKISAALLLVLAAIWSGPARADCNNLIADFRTQVDRDLKSGQLNQGTHNQIVSELDRISGVCTTNWQYRAVQALVSTQERYGYR